MANPTSQPRRPVRRHSAPGLTERKRQELIEIARRWIAARERYIDDYWAEEYAALVMRRPRELVKRRRASGWARDDLPVNFNKSAMESALGAVRGNWQATTSLVAARVRKSREMSTHERQWILYVLKSPALLHNCLIGTAEIHHPWAADIDQAKFSRALRRLLRRSRVARPRHQQRLWFEVDTNLYRPFHRPVDRHFRGAWIAVSGLRRYRRIAVPLAGDNLEVFLPRLGLRGRPSLRIDIDKRVVFETTTLAPFRRPTAQVRAGVDKGFRDLVTISTGTPEAAQSFGVGASVSIGRIADRAVERLRQRRRLQSYERSLRNTDARRASRIRKRCLGRRKNAERSRVDKLQLREQINAALNELFEQRRDLATLVVEDLRFRFARRLSPDVERRLARWLRGFLHKRLAYKAGLNGVELIVVNAAYTSQTCVRCGFTDRRNRFGAEFVCRGCGYAGSADAVAATNVLRRGSDPAITRSSTAVEVRQILDARWRSALIESAWGSNAGSTVTSVAAATSDEPRTTRGVASGPKVMLIDQARPCC